jgi:hypothetical protein
MEDESFVDDDCIEELAREYVALHGQASLTLLRKLIETMETAGDRLSTATWRAVAERVAMIMAAN